MISKELLNELQVILKEEFGMVTSPNEVFAIGTGLFSYFELLAKYRYDNEKTKKNVDIQKN